MPTPTLTACLGHCADSGPKVSFSLCLAGRSTVQCGGLHLSWVIQKSHCHPKKNLRRGSAMWVLVVNNLEVSRFDLIWSLSPGICNCCMLCLLLRQREMHVLHRRRVCTEPLLHIGHSFVTYLPLEARKCVLGLDHCVSDPDIGVGPAPPPTARRSLPCRLAPLAWPLPSSPALGSRNVVGGICRSYCGLETNPSRHRGTLTLRSVSAHWPRPSLHCQHRPPLPLHQQPLQCQ